jgi:hypothetical protein
VKVIVKRNSQLNTTLWGLWALSTFVAAMFTASNRSDSGNFLTNCLAALISWGILFGIVFSAIGGVNRLRGHAAQDKAIKLATQFRDQARTWLAQPLVPLSNGELVLHPQEHLFFVTTAQVASLRVTKTYDGGYSGASVRVARGLYFRTGGFRGSPHSSSSMVAGDKGTLYITDQRILFVGPTKSYDLPYTKIVSVEALVDGLTVNRSNASPLMFGTGDRHAYVTYLRVREKRLSALTTAEIDALFSPDQTGLTAPSN